MKIVLVGNYKWEIYEKALIDGFNYYKIKVIPYKIDTFSLKEKIVNFDKIKKINDIFLKDILKIDPDVLFFYRCNEILSSTIKKIKQFKPSIKIITYHNDNPYKGLKNKIKYYNFLHIAKYYADLVYVFRPSNINYFKTNSNVKILMPYYYSKYLIEKINFDKKIYDVIFIGHYEKDRGEIINYLLSKNINVKVFSSDIKWKKNIQKKEFLFSGVYGIDYYKTLNHAKIALTFLSKKNEDPYTRRNFEIPASGTLQFSEYTPELANIFNENEIVFFKDKEELGKKIRFYLSNINVLNKLTLNSYIKVKNGPYCEKGKALQILNDIKKLGIS